MPNEEQLIFVNKHILPHMSDTTVIKFVTEALNTVIIHTKKEIVNFRNKVNVSSLHS